MIVQPTRQLGTLVVGRWSSTCGECGRGADPQESHHHTVLSYSAEEAAKPGCGCAWTKIRSEYDDDASQAAVAAMRPDLELVRWR